jgi:hypothetical protein
VEIKIKNSDQAGVTEIKIKIDALPERFVENKVDVVVASSSSTSTTSSTASSYK